MRDAGEKEPLPKSNLRTRVYKVVKDCHRHIMDLTLSFFIMLRMLIHLHRWKTL